MKESPSRPLMPTASEAFAGGTRLDGHTADTALENDGAVAGVYCRILRTSRRGGSPLPCLGLPYIRTWIGSLPGNTACLLDCGRGGNGRWLMLVLMSSLLVPTYEVSSVVVHRAMDDPMSNEMRWVGKGRSEAIMGMVHGICLKIREDNRHTNMSVTNT